MSAKGRILRVFEKLLVEATITAVEDRGPALRWLELTPARAAEISPGDKMQLLLPSDEVRTYSPVPLGGGRFGVLVFVRADSPASRWARSAAVGDRVRLAGPSRSLTLPAGPVTVVGDETSIAVAASYARARPGQVTTVLELDEGLEADAALAALGLGQARVVRRAPSAARGSALEPALAEVHGTVGVTGGGELVQRARAALRARGVREIKTKAYWVEGRAGLD